MCAEFVYEHLVDKKLFYDNYNGCNWKWYIFLRRDSDLSNIVEYTQDGNH